LCKSLLFKVNIFKIYVYYTSLPIKNHFNLKSSNPNFSNHSRLEFGSVRLSFTFTQLILAMIFFTYLIIQVFNLDSSVLLSVLPVTIYANTDTDKALAIKENKNRSGVYK
jgi:hypothetical protein